jgi:HK97 family phage major capsid protein/HK97 family phage prohead protease
LPLLWQHRHAEPIGQTRFKKPTKQGIEFEARIPKVTEPGKLKDRVDEAWQSLKHGLVRAVSIGFLPKELSFMEDGGIHFIESEVLELSLVTIPMNADARIETIKAIDAPLLAASGMSAGARPQPPGVAGKSKAQPMKTIQEQIQGFEASRAAKVARMASIMSSEEGATLNAEQATEYDDIEREVGAIDAHLVRLRKQEELNKTKAAPVVAPPAVPAIEAASAARAGTIVQVLPKKLPPGIPFVRMVGALAMTRGNRHEAAEIAKRWSDSSPEVEAILRTPMDVIERVAVSPGTTTNPTWAQPLVNYQIMASEFIEYLRPLTVIGRIQGFRRVPFNIKVPRQTAGAAVNWVGETKVKPLSSLAFDTLTLDWYKIAGIVPLSEELVRFSSPSAELLVRDDLAAAIVQFMDSEFLDPTKAVAAGVSPASVTNGVTPTPASGTTAAAFRTDVKNMMASFITAGLPVSSGVWIMKQSRAMALSLMNNALGQSEFGNITMTGGTLLGFPVVTSEAVQATGGSPANGDNIIFLIPSEIMLADEGGINIDVSREASLQMESTPDSPPVAGTVLVSLWQHNLIAVKAERYINWQKRRAGAVAYISFAKYSP